MGTSKLRLYKANCLHKIHHLPSSLPSPLVLVRRMSRYTHCSSRNLSISVYSSFTIYRVLLILSECLSKIFPFLSSLVYSLIALFQSFIISLLYQGTIWPLIPTHHHQTLSSLRRETWFSSLLNYVCHLP